MDPTSDRPATPEGAPDASPTPDYDYDGVPGEGADPTSGTPPGPGGAGGHGSAGDTGTAHAPGHADGPADTEGPGRTDGSAAVDSGAGEGAAAPDTGTYPATGMRTGTTPRALLRPVPEGFPTPPPRPARPNRRPALPEPEQPPAHRRGVLIAALASVAVLVLAVGVGGGILAFRAFSPGDEAPAASDPADPAAPADPTDAAGAGGELVLDGITVRETSTEPGIRSVGSATGGIEPEGEFVILTVEVINESPSALTLTDWVTLETSDGQTFSPDEEAGRAHLAESEHYGIVPADAAKPFHVIFDVPIGADPAAAHLDLHYGADSGIGTLALGG